MQTLTFLTFESTKLKRRKHVVEGAPVPGILKSLNINMGDEN